MQILYGDGFDDAYYGLNTRGGGMGTLTFEHFSIWSHGDNFFYADVYEGTFVDSTGAVTGSRSRLFAEWYPTLSLSRLTGRRLAAGLIEDVFLIGEIGRGDGFRSQEIGVGCNLDVPGVHFLSVSLLARKDSLNRSTYHVSLYFTAPFRFGAVPWEIEGYSDVVGTDRHGTDVSAQLQFQVDVGALAGAGAGVVQAGIEWYYHRNASGSTSVPQALVKWTW